MVRLRTWPRSGKPMVKLTHESRSVVVTQPGLPTDPVITRKSLDRAKRPLSPLGRLPIRVTATLPSAPASRLNLAAGRENLRDPSVS